MSLANETTRCEGQLPTFYGVTQPCSHRDNCQRYIDRDTGGENTMVLFYMCPGPRSRWEFQIKGKA